MTIFQIFNFQDPLLHVDICDTLRHLIFCESLSLELVSGLKEEHRKIGQAFQSLSEHWKSVTSLKLGPDEELLKDTIDKMIRVPT